MITFAVSWYIKKRLASIRRFVENPHEVQQEQLTGLVKSAKNTVWGKEYGFESIKGYQDFGQRLPLQDYETVKAYVDRMRGGEKNLLWPGMTKWFAKSSGTTSDKSKFIPATADILRNCHYKGGKDVLAIYFNNREGSRLFSGKGLIMGGSSKVRQGARSTFYGDLSAILLLNSPGFAKFFTTPATSVALLENWEEKLEVTANIVSSQNITSISGVPSWNLILLKRILEKTDKKSLLEVWPNLELFIHGGVSFTPYREQYQKIIPSSQMYYLETYNASEGFFGIQDVKDSNDMLLMLDYGIYYEFIAMEDFHDQNPRVINLEEVEINKKYAMVISTQGGLWRYIIGDTVEFTNTSPYRIKIVGRTASYINAFGEELMVHNTDKALETACKVTGAIVSEYTGCPVYLDGNRKAAHEYIIEFEVSPDNIDEFVKLFDQNLKELNSDYEAKRSQDILLKLPVVHEAPPGTFFNWMKSRGKVGGQNKVPRLSNQRTIVQDLLQFINK